MGTLDRFSALFTRPGMSSDTRRTRLFIAAGSLVLIPVLTVVSIIDLYTRELVGAAFNLIMVSLFLGHLVQLCIADDVRPLFRVTTACALLFLSYAIWSGVGGGYVWVWTYGIPPSVFMIFGLREGALWTLVTLLASWLVMLGALGGHDYPTVAAMRHFAALLVVGLFGYITEYSRAYYYRRLLAEKEDLEQALAEKQKLRELLPICSSCRKIRDDQGYWQQLEAYLQEYSGAQFSHGICPDCAPKFYPELNPKAPGRPTSGD